MAVLLPSQFQKTNTMSNKSKVSDRYVTVYDDARGLMVKTDTHGFGQWVWKPSKKKVKKDYTPKNGWSVQKLVEAGCVVSVFHFRWATYGKHSTMKDEFKFAPYTSKAMFAPQRLIVVPSSFRKDPDYTLSSHGGYTHVRIRRGDLEVCVSSECALEDVFCYKFGVKAALERLGYPELSVLSLE